MRKNNLIKTILVFAAVLGLFYVGISQFSKIGTSNAEIDDFNLAASINSRINNIDQTWNVSTYISTRDVLADVIIAKGMNGINGDDYKAALLSLSERLKDSSKNYFTRPAWDDDDLSGIKRLASFMNINLLVDIVDGHYSALNVIANSKICSTQDAVNSCLSGAEKYNRSPWTFCTEVKDGLKNVKDNALISYTARALIPTCKKLDNYKENYSYFDDFDADYQKVKNGKSFLDSKDFTSAIFNSMYNSIDYNSAANNLDPRF